MHFSALPSKLLHSVKAHFLTPHLLLPPIYCSPHSPALLTILLSLLSCSPHPSLHYLLLSSFPAFLIFCAHPSCSPEKSPALPSSPFATLLFFHFFLGFPIATYSLKLLLQVTLRKSGLIVLRAPAQPNPVSPSPWRNTRVAENEK